MNSKQPQPQILNNSKPSGHPNLSDEINHNILQSEIEGGVWLKDIQVGSAIAVKTENREYILECRLDGWFVVGHPIYCPVFTKCVVSGSTWGGSMLKMGFVGRGMHLEFYIKGHSTITTSSIKEIQMMRIQEVV